MGQYYKPVCLNEFGNPVKSWVCSHDFGNGLKLMEHSWIGNNFVSVVEKLLSKSGDWYKQRIVWAGDYADNETYTNKNIYDLCEDDKKIKPEVSTFTNFRYIINHSKMKYVDKESVPEDKGGWKIHPLPLLTCEGNGRGGGDFRNESDIVGSWARDRISVSNEIPEGYTELKFNLTEY